MRLAPDDIVIRHGSLAVRLRPSLRAAFRLLDRHTFTGLIVGLDTINLTIIRDIIHETTDDPNADRVMIARVDAHGVRDLQHLFDPLVRLLCACYGFDPDAKHTVETRQDQGEPSSVRAYLGELFTIATGWLGWSADAALAATPEQIIAANKGFIAKHRAINGVKDEGDDNSHFEAENLPSEDEVRKGIARLKALSSQPVGSIAS